MNTPEKVKKQPKEPNKLLLVVVGVIMLAAWCVNLRWGIWAMENDRTRGGEWGDIFGAVNALFSGITLIFLIYGIWMQRYEVDLAKAELAESKEQTEAQKNALEKQNQATEQQIFESFIFRTIDTLQNEAGHFHFDKIEPPLDIEHYKGKICLKVCLNEDLITKYWKQSLLKDATFIYSRCIQNESNDYLHYLEALCSLINFAFSENPNSQEDYKNNSRQFIINYLSSYELMHVGLMCTLLPPKVFPYLSKTKLIIEKNSLFRKLKTKGTLIEILQTTFHISSWGGRMQIAN